MLRTLFYFLMYSCARHARVCGGAHACMWVCACVCGGPRLENYPHLLVYLILWGRTSPLGPPWLAGLLWFLRLGLQVASRLPSMAFWDLNSASKLSPLSQLSCPLSPYSRRATGVMRVSLVLTQLGHKGGEIKTQPWYAPVLWDEQEMKHEPRMGIKIGAQGGIWVDSCGLSGVMKQQDFRERQAVKRTVWAKVWRPATLWSVIGLNICCMVHGTLGQDNEP